MNTTKVNSAFLIILLFGFGVSFSQDVSVDPLSGRAIVSIPLYTLRYGNISVPVNLNHSETSLAVEETEGDAGFGWNLTCKYAVYRTVRGLPDESSWGWLANGNSALINGFAPTAGDNFPNYSINGEAADYNFINGQIISNSGGFTSYTRDTEPDLYTVVGPDIYLQFVYDASGTPRILNYTDVSIAPLANGGGFTIKNNIGQTFLFNKQETVIRTASTYKNADVVAFKTEFNLYSGNRTPFVQSWYLTTAWDAIGDTVKFNYSPLTPVNSYRYKTKVSGIGQSKLDTLYSISDEITPQSLSSITAGKYSVNFIWSGAERLASVKVSEAGLGDNFQYGFIYQIAQSTTPSPYFINYRYFLQKIIPTNSTCAPQAPYLFTYQGVNGLLEMPWDTYYSQDLWGQYSGYTGVKAKQGIPYQIFYANQTDSRRFSFQNIPNNTATLVLDSEDKRTVSATKVGNGALTQINYPTGGYTKIVWERNKYYDSLGGQVLFGPGLRVASLISDGGEAAFGRNATDKNLYHQIIKNYTYTKSDADTTTSGLALYPPEYAWATGGNYAGGSNPDYRFFRTNKDQSPGSYVSYRRVKETTVQGSRVYTYSLPAMYPSTSYATDWVATRTRIARNPSNVLPLNNVKNGFYTYPFAPNPNYGFSQGLLTSVAEYSTTNALVRQKQYYYTRINPALQSVYGLRFEYLDANYCDCFHFAKYEVITGTTSVLAREVATEVSEGNATQKDVVSTYYHYNKDVVNNNFLMDSVRTVWGDGSVSRKRIRYVKDFSNLTNPTVGDVMANALPTLVAANRHGEVVEEYTSLKPAGGTEVITNASLQLFQKKTVGSDTYAYPYRSLSLPTNQTFAPASIAAGATQGFVYSNRYVLQSSYDDFDAMGNPISISDVRQNKVARHFAQQYALVPVATFANTTAAQTVYDGFEFATSRHLTPALAVSYSTGWTGQQAAVLNAGNTLSHSSVANAGIPYRVSCYVMAAQNSTITFQFLDPASNAVVVATALSYTTPNQWTYLEGLLNITSLIPATLKLAVSSNATVNIDDVVVMPRNATVATQTFLPLKGATSQTDDRGNSITVAYDALGRKVKTYDRQRNLVEMNEYQFKSAPATFLSAFFSRSWQGLPVPVVAGVPFTVSTSSNANCISGLNYQWNLDGANIGSNSGSLTTTIATAGPHNLKLTVTNPITGQSDSYTEKISVLINATTPTITWTALPPNNTMCNTALQFNFTCSVSSGCGGAQTANLIAWYASNNGGSFVLIGYGNSMPYKSAAPGFTIKAVVTQTCTIAGSAMDLCTATTTAISTQDITVNVCNGN